MAGRAGKASGRTPAMDGQGKSDEPIVPTKLPNKAPRGAAEAVEGRGSAKGNTRQQNVPRTQSRTSAPSALERVRQAARRNKDAKFTALLHHVTLESLRRAFHSLRREAAPGVDGVTWEAYQKEEEGNLHRLHERLHRGAYRAKPSRRAYIPKTDGRLRPLGIASLEDKIVQRAVVEVLNAIYEVDFLGFSYGFRPGRNQHQALDALAAGILRTKVNWVLDADIRGFFDAISHEWMVKFLEHRIADRRVLRLIQKWLSAGVLQDGVRTELEEGSPQGATISPLLANIYLHYVLDLWAQRWRRRFSTGDVVIVRYADDFIVGFQKRSDAVRFLGELRNRMREFSLELHPEKTRLIQFGKLVPKLRRADGLGKAETFEFLGFTHLCGKSRGGKFLLLRRTSARRMRAKLKALKGELMRRRHLPIPEQGAWLHRVVKGYFAYYAVPTNIDRLCSFRSQVIRNWRQALRRRSQRSRMSWERMGALGARWVPSARVLHPWPEVRFDARTRGKSRVR
jgi:RNA-directed DNA polymerase